MGVRDQIWCTADSDVSGMAGKNENINLQCKPYFSNSSLRGCCYLQCWSIIWAFHFLLCLPIAVVTEGALLLFYLCSVHCDMQNPFNSLVWQHFIIERVKIQLIILNLHDLRIFSSFFSLSEMHFERCHMMLSLWWVLERWEQLW